MKRSRLLAGPIAGLVLGMAVAFGARAGSIDASVPGSYPLPRSYSASYRAGWSGLTAARVDAKLDASPGRITLTGTGATVGLVRALWRLDAMLESEVRIAGLRSVRSRLEERYRDVTSVITHDFDGGGVHYKQVETPPPKRPSKPKYIRNTNASDLFGALLRLRSQELADSDVVSVLEVQGNTLYVATLTVERREEIRCAGRRWPAIRLALKLQRIGKDGSLEPHRKFRSGTAWISDDEDRLLLKVESEVFVGAVFAELDSVSLP